jgi:hypothetical protein
MLINMSNFFCRKGSYFLGYWGKKFKMGDRGEMKLGTIFSILE